MYRLRKEICVLPTVIFICGYRCASSFRSVSYTGSIRGIRSKNSSSLSSKQSSPFRVRGGPAAPQPPVRRLRDSPVWETTTETRFGIQMAISISSQASRMDADLVGAVGVQTPHGMLPNLQRHADSGQLLQGNLVGLSVRRKGRS